MLEHNRGTTLPSGGCIPRRATGPILGIALPVPEMHSTEDVGFQPRVRQRHYRRKKYGKGVYAYLQDQGTRPVLSRLLRSRNSFDPGIGKFPGPLVGILQ